MSSEVLEKSSYVTKSQPADLEAEANDHDSNLLPNRAEQTELTPVEAFKWNVEGDESPCREKTPSAIRASLTDAC
jgi:hypothetical protein